MKQVHVIFKRSLLDVITGCPKEATFTGFKCARLSDAGLHVLWDSEYFYPYSSIRRVRFGEAKKKD